jgi:hypothetical protein
MARNAARLKMGYYPLPESEAVRLRALLNFTGPASVVDPCVGQGTALEIITQGADVRRYGVELDAERAAIAQSKGIETIQGNAFDAVAKPESFSLLYLNPPYDSEIGQVANNRMERLFLDHTYRWLAMDGVLAMVIPFERLMDCAGLLSSHFTALNVFRMTDEESVRFRQIAVLGLRSNVRGSAIDANKRHLQRIGLYGNYQELPELAPDACEPYRVPLTSETALSYRGLPYDLLEDLLPHSGAWKQVMPFLAPHEEVACSLAMCLNRRLQPPFIDPGLDLHFSHMQNPRQRIDGHHVAADLTDLQIIPFERAANSLYAPSQHLCRFRDCVRGEVLAQRIDLIIGPTPVLTANL